VPYGGGRGGVVVWWWCLLQDDPDFYPELKNDLREEAQKFGDVEVVTVFEVRPLCLLLYFELFDLTAWNQRNPEGVVAIKFVEPEAAIK